MSGYDFGTGNTNPEGFPADELAAAAARIIPQVSDQLNQYPGKLGYEPMRQMMVDREAEREGVRLLDPDRLILTNGSMQAITLVAEALCTGTDDVVVMEEHCYVGTISAYRALGIEMAGIPLDAYGMRMDALADTLARLHDEGRPPRFIYTLPTYQNPTGFMMPKERRLELLALAEQYQLIVVEDNCYADVHFEGEKPPALYTLDDSDRQVYMCSLSKIFAPGVRLGYLYARGALFDRFLDRRQDAGPNTLAAAITTEYLSTDLWGHIERANVALKAKRDAMLEALEVGVGNTCSWSHPVGGLFIWVRLPDNVDLGRLAELCEARGVTYAPGSNFYVKGTDVPYIRLAFGYPSVEQIRAGVPVLGQCIRDACGA
ncbi:MAG: PLP-dependent aminotransferase family protein [Gammaproteobacteria bacterium]|nr:PLP-dependent aminotransferase family protein [Gammaproteobacteria bacterium]